MKSLILLSVVVYLSGCNGFLNKRWDNDVYTGRQFDDMVTKTQVASSEVMTRALLVLYAPSCEDGLRMEKLAIERLPPMQYMVYAKHDYESSDRCVWYQKDYRDKLTTRYKLEKCLEFLYFEKGTSLLDQPEKYSKSLGYGVFHWVWGKFGIQLKVLNERERRVMVEFHGQGPKLSAFTIEANSEMTLDTYASYFIVISCAERKTFIYGAELDLSSDGSLIAVETTTRMEMPVNVWFSNVQKQQAELSVEARNWRWNLAEIYLHDFKQPVLLPKFTDLGYKKGIIPLDLYESLVTFYDENIDKKRPESHSVEPAINDKEVKCSMVHLSQEMIDKTATTMLPLMEAWSNVTLEMTRLYGIREYYTGNILRDHVDRVTTHVVSVILQIDKDLGGQPDWELEVIGFDGLRKNVTLQPGEYLFYESATLIHGRPFPYKGKVFANAFLHYRPVNGWKWGLHKDGHWFLFDGKQKEPTDILGTEFMYDRKINMDRFEEIKSHSHDEL